MEASQKWHTSIKRQVDCCIFWDTSAKLIVIKTPCKSISCHFDFSFLAQGVLTIFQPGAKHVNFYICSGNDPTLDIESPLKFRGVMFAIFVLTICLHIAVPIKIKLHKQQLANQEIIVLTSHPSVAVELDKNSVVDVIIHIVHLLVFAFGLALSLHISKINPFQIHFLCNFVPIFCFNVLLPAVALFLICATYYFRHPNVFSSIRKSLITYLLAFL